MGKIKIEIHQNVSDDFDLNVSLKKKKKVKKSFHKINQEQNINSNNSMKNQKRKNESSDLISSKKVKLVEDDKNVSSNYKAVKQKPFKFLNQKTKVADTPLEVSSKAVKPSNMTRKDWKILHLDKTAKSPKENSKKEPTKKGGWKELHMKEKGKSEILEVGKTLKHLWEELRREDCKPDRKSQLLKQVCDHLKGRVKEFTFAHDTVRVLECVLALGAETHRSLLFDELKAEFLALSKSKYGKFFLMKMLRYGTKQQKDEIMKSFHGKIIKLLRHSQAAEVLELAFNECANGTQRFEMIQEFFGASYKFFKVTDVNSVEKLIEANPEKKSTIVKNMKEELIKVLNKAVVKHSIVHHVLWQFMKICDDSSRSEIIDSLKEIVPEILHTKDGSRVGLRCLWYGSIKERKIIVKSLKRFVSKIAMEEYGHMVLLATFDVVDDTLLIEKNIIRELKKNLLELSQNIHGKKVLIYLLNPRDPHFFPPGVINILQAGDNNPISKKAPEIRHSELKAIIAEPLLKLITQNIEKLYTNNAFCLFTCVILQHTVGDKKEALEAIADLLVEPYTTENKNTHPVEHPGSSFMFKQLIKQDTNTPNADCFFSETLINKVPKCVMSSWIECNRGAFLLVSLIETNIPSVVARIKEETEGRKKYLMKKNFKGADILLKKLKS